MHPSGISLHQTQCAALEGLSVPEELVMKKSHVIPILSRMQITPSSSRNLGAVHFLTMRLHPVVF